jgi:hypothetical protein
VQDPEFNLHCHKTKTKQNAGEDEEKGTSYTVGGNVN